MRSSPGAFYSLDLVVEPDPSRLDGGWEPVETGYNATIDEVCVASGRHLDPNREPDTRIKKDRTIIAVVGRLDLDRRGWVIHDSWEGEAFSIGIGARDNPRQLVGVTTYADKPDRFAYHCETPTGPDPDDLDVVDEAEDVSFETLVAAMERHLG